ncbi:uncharacterized protein LOC110229444 [Arabidopsis lyrata subsp. lyrata]|uniref:uncharacterized protein LOC110229444 n=1 Tax=Arabidopsis lyrata subsp. lyrata TaxID=81972 RepID=UPI000A29BC58|nr:uncharacterized protein LOC110229444 [Arabidopsis lyrata subsp. lyrata]|eukprot:XP_020885299.1 uncharacterized protein LOC110229444 [Arabidopsis lyrata subsp. lyrata]
MHELDFEFINLNQPKMYKFVVCLLTLSFLLLSGLSNTALARVHHESSNPKIGNAVRDHKIFNYMKARVRPSASMRGPGQTN